MFIINIETRVRWPNLYTAPIKSWKEPIGNFTNNENMSIRTYNKEWKVSVNNSKKSTIYQLVV